MPQNAILTVSLLSWPIIVFFLSAKLGAKRAAAWTVLGALLFLPTSGSFRIAAGIPVLDKISVTFLGLILLTFSYKRTCLGIRSRLATIFFIGLTISPFLTAITNQDVTISGGSIIAGLDWYEGISATANQFFFIYSFLFARKYFTQNNDILLIMKVNVVGGLIYILPAALEIILSPFISRILYGIDTFIYVTDARYGGYRPIVLLGNGLNCSFFFAVACISSIVLYRIDARTSVASKAKSTVLFVMLGACKAAASFLYGCLGLLLMSTLRSRSISTAAAIIALIAFFYPILRSNDLFPVQKATNIVSEFDVERAGSIRTRFEQEDALLQRASERPLFGWGRFGRNRVFDQGGTDVTLSDGRWIIILGQYGYFGFIAEFGLILTVILRARAKIRSISDEAYTLPSAGLSLILSVILLDQLPNASISPWAYFICGSLLGWCELAGQNVTSSFESKPLLLAMKNYS